MRRPAWLSVRWWSSRSILTVSFCAFAAVWLVALIISVALMINAFSKISRTAAYIQIPYLLWCIFALYLNIGICVLR